MLLFVMLVIGVVIVGAVIVGGNRWKIELLIDCVCLNGIFLLGVFFSGLLLSFVVGETSVWE